MSRKLSPGILSAALTIVFAGMLFVAHADRIIRFNDGWKFYRGDVSGAQSSTFSDASWQTVYLPHADSILLNTATSSIYQGYCWYRKTFTADASMQGKKLFLEIEAAMQTASIYVNGDSLTTHLGGYTPIVLDITSHIHFGASNVIAARLNNTPSSSFPPATTNPDFLYFGGMYRNVYLHVADSLHVTNPILANIPAGGGIFVTNSAVAAGAATASVYVNTNVLNEYNSSRPCRLRTTIVNASNQVVASKTDSIGVAAGASTTFTDTLTVPSPQLWNPATPFLYSVVSQVYDNARLADSCSTTFGIRTISFTKANGFQINGQRLKFRGADRHQSFPYLGNALPNSGQYRDALLMKQYGFNFVRMCHYTQSIAFVDACDRLGMLGQACEPGWQSPNFGSSGVMFNNCLAALRDMIRYYRNHPSVILYEAQLNESTESTVYYDSAQALAHREFPGSQMYTCGEDNTNTRFDVYISSSQHSVRSYGGTKPCAISEYGDWDVGPCNWATTITGCADRVTRAAREDSLVTQAMNHASGRGQNLALAWFTGDALWSMFDYQSWVAMPLTTSGCIDLFRIPKFSAYFYKSQRSPADTMIPAVKGGPMVYLATTWRPTSSLTVRAFSNCDSVSLYLNNTLVSTQGPATGTNLEHPYFTFTVPSFQAGTLRADGKIGGVVKTSCSVNTPGSAKSIALTIDTAGISLQADGSDIAIVYASILDSNGTVIPNASTSVTFSVTDGSGTLIGVNPMPAQAGIAAILLRAGTTPGLITVNASATGLTGTSAKVTSIAQPGTGINLDFKGAATAKRQSFSIRCTGGVLYVYAPAQLAPKLGARFALYNAAGRQIGKWNIAAGITAVKMTSLPHGLYLGEITGTAGKFVQKVVW